MALILDPIKVNQIKTLFFNYINNPANSDSNPNWMCSARCQHCGALFHVHSHLLVLADYYLLIKCVNFRVWVAELLFLFFFLCWEMLTCVTLRGCWEISVSLARLCDAQWSLLDTVQHCTSAATRLRAFSVKWKCEIIRFIWFVTAVIRYYKLNVFFGATISAEFSSQYRLLHLGERLWGLNLTPEINTFLRCCGCHNLHKSDWSPCNKIQISESLQTFFFDLLKHSWEQIILVGFFYLVEYLNLIVFTDLKGFIWFWPFLCQWAPRAPRAYAARKRGSARQSEDPPRNKTV